MTGISEFIKGWKHRKYRHRSGKGAGPEWTLAQPFRIPRDPECLIKTLKSEQVQPWEYQTMEDVKPLFY